MVQLNKSTYDDFEITGQTAFGDQLILHNIRRKSDGAEFNTFTETDQGKCQVFTIIAGKCVVKLKTEEGRFVYHDITDLKVMAR